MEQLGGYSAGEGGLRQFLSCHDPQSTGHWAPQTWPISPKRVTLFQNKALGENPLYRSKFSAFLIPLHGDSARTGPPSCRSALMRQPGGGSSSEQVVLSPGQDCEFMS